MPIYLLPIKLAIELSLRIVIAPNNSFELFLGQRQAIFQNFVSNLI